MPVTIKLFWPATSWLAFATVLFCLPGSALPNHKWFNVIFLDKWIHLILFSILVVFVGLPVSGILMKKKTQRVMQAGIVAICFLYGIAMEFVQHYFIPNRSFDVNDILFDGLGCLLGDYLVHYQLKKIPIKKICFYGPESTGKSTMAKHFAESYKTEFVSEVAREMITSNSFTVEDIVAIGKAQTERIIAKAKQANKVLFCDTDLITTQLYSQHYLQTIPTILYELEQQVSYDYYFLFDVDAPWVADGLRDLGHDDDRQKMFELFKTELEKRKITYTLVRGNYHERQEVIQKKLAELL
jgi:nicotinamide riboside kinase/VanZ family protein